jgi:hypothetical protein
MNLSRGAQLSFDACKYIYERAGGYEFKIKELDLSRPFVEHPSEPVDDFPLITCRQCKCSSDDDSQGDCFKSGSDFESSSDTPTSVAIGDVLCECASSACKEAIKHFYS